MWSGWSALFVEVRIRVDRLDVSVLPESVRLEAVGLVCGSAVAALLLYAVAGVAPEIRVVLCASTGLHELPRALLLLGLKDAWGLAALAFAVAHRTRIPLGLSDCVHERVCEHCGW